MASRLIDMHLCGQGCDPNCFPAVFFWGKVGHIDRWGASGNKKGALNGPLKEFEGVPKRLREVQGASYKRH